LTYNTKAAIGTLRKDFSDYFADVITSLIRKRGRLGDLGISQGLQEHH